MTIDRIAPLSFQSTADQDNASRDDDQAYHRAVVEAYCDSLEHAPSVPNLSRSASSGAPRLIPTVRKSPLDIDNFRTFVGHHAMLWYAPTIPGLPAGDFEAPRGPASGCPSFGSFLEVVRAKMVVAGLVETVNPRAKFSVCERGDVIIMRADNRAARNMFRAYSGLINAKMAKTSDATAPSVTVELHS